MLKFLVITCVLTGFIACNTKKDYDRIFRDHTRYCAGGLPGRRAGVLAADRSKIKRG